MAKERRSWFVTLSCVFLLAAAVGCGDDAGSDGNTAGMTAAGMTAAGMTAAGAGATAGMTAGTTAGVTAGVQAGTGAAGEAGTGPSLDPLLLTQVTAGERDSCGLDAAGGIHCWGDNSLADLVGEPARDAVRPTKLETGETYKQVVVGNGHRCALQQDDTIVCWGDDTWAALGVGLVRTNVYPPEAVGVAGPWKSVSALYRDTCAVHGTGKLYCWGSRLFQSDVPVQIGTDTDWAAVATGQAHACALKTDSTVHCWGNNGFGQLGIGSSATESAMPTQVGTDTDWVEIASGNFHSCARKSSGVVQCWGQNIEGALGDTTFERRNAPVVATTSSDWRMLSLSESSSCAINADKKLWCWGKLSIPFQPQPYIESVAPPLQIGKEHDWSSVAAGPAHACAITTDGETYCWGDNGFGQLGDGLGASIDGLVRISK